MPPNPSQLAPLAPSRSGPILVVDDDPVVATVLASHLRGVGYECVVVHDAAAAWERLTPELSLVLLDIMLPGESGTDVMRRMLLDPTLSKIPVVFVTGRADVGTRIQCLAMGAQGFLLKPVRAAELIATVRRVATDGAGAPGESADHDLLAAVLGPELGAVVSEAARGCLDGASDPTAEIVQGLLAERRALRRRLEASHRLVAAIFRLHQMASVGIPPDTMAVTVAELAQKVLNAVRATVWLPSGDVLRPVAAAGAPLDAAPLAASAPGPVARAWQSLQAVETGAADTDGLEAHLPLSLGGQGLGVLSVGFRPGSRPSATLAGLFCAEAATALDAGSRLQRAQNEARTDPLTGLFNRRFLEQRLDEELRRAQSQGSRLSVLFLDIDHFKRINDRWGHDRGDAVLRLVASTLRDAVRGIDLAVRYGGEEFVLVLPETRRQDAIAVAERVRAAVARRGDAPGDGGLSVTIGVATFPDDAVRADALLARADAAMLCGKRAGRNRVESCAGRAPVPRPASLPRGSAVVVRTLVRALATKDVQTYRHSLAVGGLSARLARRMGCDQTEVRLAGQAGLLHDVGKLHVPDEVLLKPGPLTEAERAVMERHAPLGGDLAWANPETRHLAPLVRASQETFDGSGYPDGLAGDRIPLVARIITVVDAYDAMSTDRPYRRALPPGEVIAELHRHAGGQFDPRVVAALLDLLGAGARARRSRSAPSASPLPPTASAALLPSVAQASSAPAGSADHPRVKLAG